MKESVKKTLSSVMSLAWTFVRRNGVTISEALRVAWRNIKLRVAMQKDIVKFRFVKVSGEIREAYGTLRESLLPPTSGNRKASDLVQVYFDTERGAYRSFKKINLLSIC